MAFNLAIVVASSMMLSVKGDVAASPLSALPAAAGTTTDTDELTSMGYSTYVGQDYAPNQIPPPATGIQDIGSGSIVQTAAECASECDADAMCNALSYYGDLPEGDWPGNKNCYIKTLDGCELPSDAESFDDGRIFMIHDDKCLSVLFTADAPMADSPIADFPFAAESPFEAEAPLADSPLPTVLTPFVDAIAPTEASAPIGFASSPIATSPLSAAAPTSAAFPSSARAISPTSAPALTGATPSAGQVDNTSAAGQAAVTAWVAAVAGLAAFAAM